jgi:ferrous iron transport protein A
MQKKKGDTPAMMPLALLSPGEKGEIVDIRVHQHKQACCGQCGGERHKAEYRIEDLGLRAGKVVEMLGGGGPVLLRIDESRIAVDRGMAMKIMVRKA